MAKQDRQIAKLRRVLEVSRQMAVTTDLDRLLGIIIDAACDVLDCERATIFLHDATGGELRSRVATGVASIRIPVGSGIAGLAASQRAMVNVPDAYADPRFNPEIDQQTGFHTRNLLAFPLEDLDGRLMGVLQALNRRGGPFTSEDEELARVLSAQAGVALQRHELLEQYAQKRRMAHDLELARRIQQAQLPKVRPAIARYEVTGWNCPADQTGGDCYDFIPLEGDRYAFLLADASGHGIGAALVIAQCRSLMRAMLSVTGDLVEASARVNRILCHDLTDGRFVTSFVGVLDPQRHRLHYVAAGQGPVLMMAPQGVEARSAGSLPLAVLPEAQFQLEQCDFVPQATLVLLTDGFYETFNPQGEQLGEDRIIALLRRHQTASLDDLLQALLGLVHEFAGGTPQTDDLTAVLIRRVA